MTWDVVPHNTRAFRISFSLSLSAAEAFSKMSTEHDKCRLARSNYTHTYQTSVDVSLKASIFKNVTFKVVKRKNPRGWITFASNEIYSRNKLKIHL